MNRIRSGQIQIFGANKILGATTPGDAQELDAGNINGIPNGWVFGISGSAVIISINGDLQLTGSATVTLDEKGNLQTAKLVSPGSKVQQDDVEGAYFYKDTASSGDYLWLNIQLNHDRRNGASLSPHLHWVMTTSATPNWVIQRRYQRQGAAKTTAWTNSRWSSHAFTWVSGSLNQITDFTDFNPPAGDGISDIVQIRLIRDTNNSLGLFSGSDTVVGDQYVSDFDIHKEVNSMGSREEYIK